MILTSGLVIIMFIMGGLLHAVHCHQRLDHYRRMANGTRYIGLLEKVLEHLPQHRGMANTLLNGDTSFLAKMKGMQQTLEQDIGAIDHHHREHAVHDDIDARWQTIKSGWQRLKQEVQSLNAADSFERHSVLIAELLYLISDASDRMGLNNHPQASVRGMIQTAFNLLPPIIETIGQARGIGSGAAARGTLLTTVRIKLEFLHERLGNNARSAYSTIEQCLGGARDFNINRDRIGNSRQQTHQFLDTLSHHMLGERITISATDCFSAGTSAFNQNLALLGEITAMLEQQIATEIPKLRSWYIGSITVGASGALLLLTCWWNLALT